MNTIRRTTLLGLAGLVLVLCASPLVALSVLQMKTINGLKIPQDHEDLLNTFLVIHPQTDDATITRKLVYVGQEKFGENQYFGVHSGWLYLEVKPDGMSQAQAFVDIWYSGDMMMHSRYTVEIAKLEEANLRFTWRGTDYEIAAIPSYPGLDTSGKAPGYWVTEIEWIDLFY